MQSPTPSGARQSLAVAGQRLHGPTAQSLLCVQVGALPELEDELELLVLVLDDELLVVPLVLDVELLLVVLPELELELVVALLLEVELLLEVPLVLEVELLVVPPPPLVLALLLSPPPLPPLPAVPAEVPPDMVPLCPQAAATTINPAHAPPTNLRLPIASSSPGRPRS